MANSQRLATVRSAIEGYLASQADQPGSDSGDDGLSGDDGSSIDCVITTESILIRDEHYCGRRFSTTTHRAVWFIEEDQVKIYTTDQRLCCVLNTDEIDAAAAMEDNSSPHVISIHSRQVDVGDVDDSTGGEEIRRAA